MTSDKFIRMHALRLTFLLSGAALVCVVCSSSDARAVTPETNSVLFQAAVIVPTLDAKHLFALGMIETGNNDREIGAAGEVSRYQIHPAVWKVYSPSLEYTNPEISLQVARQHWIYLVHYFKEKAGREPDDFDMYVLWNTKHGYYARRGFSTRQISTVVRDRAQRFVNLVNRQR